MTFFIAALLTVIAIGVALYLYMHWAVERMVAESPRIQVTLAAEGVGITRATLRSRGTSRAFTIVRLTVSREEASALGLQVPDGFMASHAVAGDPALLVWTPTRRIRLQPNQQGDLLFRYEHSTATPTAIRGDAEARLGIGGTGVRFTILVGETDPERLARRNLESEIYALAAERGVIPRELPEWSKLEALDRAKGPE
jgi:hypothetical protein